MDDWSIWGSIMKLLKARWKFVALLGVIGGVVGLASAIADPVVYTAKAEVVTGNYALPADIGTDPAVEKTGPLGLELPAETQALIIASPSIAADASAQLGLGEDEASVIAGGISAAPTTDNSYLIGVKGPTAETAVRNANAVAAAFLEYRAGVGRDELLRLADQRQATATEDLEAAVALDAPIDAALDDGNNTYASVLLTRRQELEGLASTASASSAALESAAASFSGGGEILRPATAGTVSSSLSAAELGALGCLLGLVVGFALVVLLRQVGNRVLDDTDVTRSTGVHTVAEVGAGRTLASAGQLFVRSIVPPSSEDGSTPRTILLRPVTSGPGIAPGLALLANGLLAQGQSFVVLALDPTAATEMQQLQDHSSVEAGSLTLLSGAARADAQEAAGVASSVVLASTGTTAAPEVVLLVSGTAEDSIEQVALLPRSFDGTAVLLVRRDKDTVSNVSQVTRKLQDAGVTIGGTIILDRTRRTSSDDQPRSSAGRSAGRSAAAGLRTRRKPLGTQPTPRALAAK